MNLSSLYFTKKPKRRQVKTACVSAVSTIGESVALLKVRDRNYVPRIRIVREMQAGVEIAYLLDTWTGWSEGVNEYGIGVVSSALMVLDDENEKKKPTGNSRNGKRIRRILGAKDLPAAIELAVSNTVSGCTFISDGTKTVLVEYEPDVGGNPILKHLKDGVVVRTNHGVFLEGAGYTKGKDLKSSEVRKQVAEKTLKNIKNVSDIALAMVKSRKKDRSDPNNAIRATDNMTTSTQIVMVPKDRKMMIYLVPNEVDFLGVDNKLPKGRKPKTLVEVFDFENWDSDNPKLVMIEGDLETFKLFTYGSMMGDPSYKKDVLRSYKGILKGHHRAYNRFSQNRGDIAVIGTEPGGVIEGVVHEYPVDIAHRVLGQIDRREGFRSEREEDENSYLRSFLPVQTEGKEVRSVVYLSNPDGPNYFKPSTQRALKQIEDEGSPARKYLKSLTEALATYKCKDFYVEGLFKKMEKKSSFDPKLSSLYFATKSESEKEDEKVEDLVKRLPKKKPPRKDLKKKRIEEEDPDLGGWGAEGDEDLSLNYKKVGQESLKTQFLEERGEDRIVNPETDQEVALSTLSSKPEGKAQDLFQKEFEKWKEEAEEEEPKKTEKVEEEGTEEASPDKKEKIDERVKGSLRSDQAEDVTDALVHFNDAQKEKFYALVEGLNDDELSWVADSMDVVKKTSADQIKKFFEISATLDLDKAAKREFKEKLADLGEDEFKDFIDELENLDAAQKARSEPGQVGFDTESLTEIIKSQIEETPETEDPRATAKRLFNRSLQDKLFNVDQLSKLPDPTFGVHALVSSLGASDDEKVKEKASEIRRNMATDINEALKKLPEGSDEHTALKNAQFGLYVGHISARDEGSLEGIDGPPKELANLVGLLKSEGRLDELLEGGLEAWSGAKGFNKLKKLYSDLPQDDQIAQFVEGKSEDHPVRQFAEMLDEDFCPSNPINDKFKDSIPRKCPIKVSAEDREFLKEFLLDSHLNESVLHFSDPNSKKDPKKAKEMREKVKKTVWDKGLKDIQNNIGMEGYDAKAALQDLNKRLISAVVEEFDGLENPTPPQILMNSIGEGKSPPSALGEPTDPPLEPMMQTSSMESLYIIRNIEGLYFPTPLYSGDRRELMKKLSRQSVETLTSDLDKIATFFQKRGFLVGIPKKVAMDFAYRCDLLSDAAEKHVGVKTAEEVEEEIGETETEDEGFTQINDELLEEVGGSKQSSLSKREENVDDIWEDY